MIRRALAQRLRELRVGREPDRGQAAALVGFSDSKMTKVELAQAVASREDVLKMLGRLRGVTATSGSCCWPWSGRATARSGGSRPRARTPKFGSYLGLEAVATSLQAYDTTWSTGSCRPPTTPAP